jgi:hypothetical protein
MPHHIPKLEAKVKAVQDIFGQLGDDTDWVELLKILRRPGWTTPAEFTLVSAILDSLENQARSALALRGGLLTGAREVGVG